MSNTFKLILFFAMRYTFFLLHRLQNNGNTNTYCVLLENISETGFSILFLEIA